MFRNKGEEYERKEYEDYLQELEEEKNNSDKYQSKDEYKKNFYNSDSEDDSEDDSDSEDDDYDHRYFDAREERFIREIKTMMYLGPLYKKCDNRKIGVTAKELKNRLEYLKKANRVSKDCNLEEFVDICKLHQVPYEAESCYVSFEKMLKGFSVDLIKNLMKKGVIHDTHFEFLIHNFGKEMNLSVDLLILAIYLNYESRIISKIIDRLEERGIKPETEYIEVSLNNVLKFNLIERIFENENYNAYFTDRLIQYLNIPVWFELISYIPIDKATNPTYLNILLKNVSILELEDTDNITKILINMMNDYMSEGLKEEYKSIHKLLVIYDRDLFYRKFNHLIKEKVAFYNIWNMEVITLLIELGILENDFDLEEYEEEMNIRRIQAEQGIETVNVHSASTNNINNKIIKTLIPNPAKEKDILNLDFTTLKAREFLSILQLVNDERIRDDKQPFNITIEDILMCQQYFYDYDDRLRGRDNTPAGEGVEVCNVFVKIWELAKEQLRQDQLYDYTERLAEEFESILQKDNTGRNNPVCSTGWATRLVNSIIGTAVDIGVIPEPELKIIVKEINLFVNKKRAELDESKDEKVIEEAEAFDDSIAMISDDNFEIAKQFINKRSNEFINKLYKEYKFTGIRKSRVRELANEAREKLFTV